MSIYRAGLFAGRVAIVTGGGTGIGAATAQELASLGCRVVLASRKLDRLQTTSQRINAAEPVQRAGGDTFPVTCDIRDEAQTQSLVSDTVARFSRLDFLVNNGGGQFLSPLATMTTKGWNAVMTTNLQGTFNMTMAAFRYWQRSKKSNEIDPPESSAIVNVLVNGDRGFPLMAHTGAARAAVQNFQQSAAVEWASLGIRINGVQPGIIYSDTAAANYPQDVFGQAVQSIPAQRSGTVEETSSAIVFLLSPGASFISGATLRVDGAHFLFSPNMPPPHKESQPWPVYGDSSYVTRAGVVEKKGSKL